MKQNPLGNTGIIIPGLIFGSGMLGNLYNITPYERKLATIKEMFKHIKKPVVIDSAGKYGAGLALETLGNILHELGIKDDEIIISNKLAWLRTPLTTAEPTFEPGVWFGLEYDARQDISYNGILNCWEQGLELLGGNYSTELVSVHDPDEYLNAATSDEDSKKRFDDILGAYTALSELRDKGEVKAIGVGAKDWKSIQKIDQHVRLDWVMFANSYTLYSHPIELLHFMDTLHEKGVAIINSAVFNAGFLTGGEFFNYRKLNANHPDDQEMFQWREKFFALCDEHHLKASEVCIQFGKAHPGIVAVALSTSKPERVQQNVDAMSVEIPSEFWQILKDEQLLMDVNS